jgi:mono/diheme cytochrome c family protein
MNLTVSMLLIVSLAISCAGAPPPGTLGPCPGPLEDPSIVYPDAHEISTMIGEPERGDTLFAAQCAKCHSARVVDRSSRLFRGYPRLDCASYHAEVSDGYLRRVIAQGGPSVGLDSTMRPFAMTLSEQEITDLIAYLRGQAH